MRCPFSSVIADADVIAAAACCLMMMPFSLIFDIAAIFRLIFSSLIIFFMMPRRFSTFDAIR